MSEGGNDVENTSWCRISSGLGDFALTSGGAETPSVLRLLRHPHGRMDLR